MKIRGKKNFIFGSLLLVVLVSVVLADIVITPSPSNPPGTTSNSTINISYTIDTDYLNSTIFSWNGANYSFVDNSLQAWCNFDNRSSLSENDTWTYCWNPYGGFNGSITGYNVTNPDASNISWYPLGKYGGAFNFTKKFNGINFSSGKDWFGANYTFSIWLNIPSSSNDRIFYYYNGTQGVYFTSNLGPVGKNYGWQTLSPTTVLISHTWVNNSFGKWVNLLVTRAGSNTSMYINGVYENSTSLQIGNFSAPNTIFYLGYQNAAANSFNGSMDDMIIFNRSFSSSEANELYRSQITKFNSTRYIRNSSESVSINPQSYYFCSSNSTVQSCSASNSISSLSTLKTNFSNLNQSIKADFYGINLVEPNWILSNPSHIDKNNDYVTESAINQANMKSALINSNVGLWNVDMNLHLFYSNTTDSSGVNRTINGTAYWNLTGYKELVEYAYAQNKTLMMSILYMPSWLGDNSTGWCNSLTLCIPSNYTKFSNIVIDFINYTTSNGLYLNTVLYQFWNEPYGTNYFMNLLSSGNQKYANYTYFYNQTYNALKAAYPNIKIGVGSGADYTPEFNNYILANLTNRWDFINLHTYGNGNSTDLLAFNFPFKGINSFMANCTSYSADCSKLYVGEWGWRNITIKNESNFQGQHSKASYGITYLLNLNYWASNLSMDIHRFTDRYSFVNNPTFNAQDNNLWTLVSDAGLDNTETTYYPSYNVTKNFAHLCPAGGQVYTSSSDDANLKVVSCKSGNDYGIIVINAGTDSKNVSLNLSGAYPYNSITNYETGTSYPSYSGIAQLGVLDSYGILYLNDGLCGNGLLNVGETCDDGNLINGDGCSSVCSIEVVSGAPGIMPNNSISNNPVQDNATKNNTQNANTENNSVSNVSQQIDEIAKGTEDFVRKYIWFIIPVILIMVALGGRKKRSEYIYVRRH